MNAASMKNVSRDYDDCQALYEAYMPFIKQAALFVRTNDTYAMGEDVLLDLHLMNEPDRIEIQARVIWLTPVGAQGGRAAGIGVQFCGEYADKLRSKIETYLAGMLDSPRQTDTL